MSDEWKAESVPLDLATGLVVYKGQTYTYQELIDLWEEEQDAEMDRIAELRDFTADNQNLWGNKDGGRNGTQYRDDWFHKRKGYKRRRGYPRDVSY